MCCDAFVIIYKYLILVIAGNKKCYYFCKLEYSHKEICYYLIYKQVRLV